MVQGWRGSSIVLQFDEFIYQQWDNFQLVHGGLRRGCGVKPSWLVVCHRRARACKFDCNISSQTKDWIFGLNELGTKLGPGRLGLGDDSAEGIIVGEAAQPAAICFRSLDAAMDGT